MKKKSPNTVRISIIAAVAIWAIATLFEGNERWQDLSSREPPDLSMPTQRADTPVRTDTTVASCEQAEDMMRASVSASQACLTDSDCTLFDYGYPIQCLTSVNKSEITALRLEYRNYERSCAYRVYYDCPSGEAEREAVCRNQRCEVELVTIDALKDETLEYLGIQ